VPAQGVVDYQYTSLPTELTRDRWIRAIEVRPGAREVVHHVLAYAMPAEAFEGGRLRRWDLLDERRGFFAAWAPGSEPVQYTSEGHARRLERGTVLMFELHYTPNGREARDRSRIGVHFALRRTPNGARSTSCARRASATGSIQIPAGAAAHDERRPGSRRTRDARARVHAAHAPARVPGVPVRACRPDGTTHALLDVPRYDFNWQLRYEFDRPARVAAGERLEVILGSFDNSSAEPRESGARAAIGGVPNTKDEMLIGFVDYVLEEEPMGADPNLPHFVVLDPRTQGQLAALAAAHDGKVPRGRLPERARADFDRLDRNGDGVLDESELRLPR
jgi:hypothetical protein